MLFMIFMMNPRISAYKMTSFGAFNFGYTLGKNVSTTKEILLHSKFTSPLTLPKPRKFSHWGT